MYMCPIPSGFRARDVSLYNSKLFDKKEILCTVSNTGIYCSSDKVASLPSIIYFRKLHSQHQCTLQLVWVHGVLLVCTVYSVLYSEITLSRKMFAIGHTYIYTLLLRVTDTVTSQNIDLSLWDILYKNTHLPEDHRSRTIHHCGLDRGVTIAWLSEPTKLSEKKEVLCSHECGSIPADSTSARWRGANHESIEDSLAMRDRNCRADQTESMSVAPSTAGAHE
jgi:hypothetical protein